MDSPRTWYASSWYVIRGQPLSSSSCHYLLQEVAEVVVHLCVEEEEEVVVHEEQMSLFLALVV